MANQAINLRIDAREFQAALKEIIRTDKKSMAYVLNDQAYRLAETAMKLTHKANDATIKKLVRLGRGSGERRKAKRGKKGAVGAGAFGIFHTWKFKRGFSAGRASYADVQKYFNSRSRSIGFVKSQWMTAMEAVSNSGRKFKKPYGAAKWGGYGKAARYSQLFKPFALIGVNMRRSGELSLTQGNPLTFLEQGLREAVPARVMDMKRKIEDRLNRNHAKHQAKIL